MSNPIIQYFIENFDDSNIIKKLFNKYVENYLNNTTGFNKKDLVFFHLDKDELKADDELCFILKFRAINLIYKSIYLEIEGYNQSNRKIPEDSIKDFLYSIYSMVEMRYFTSFLSTLNKKEFKSVSTRVFDNKMINLLKLYPKPKLISGQETEFKMLLIDLLGNDDNLKIFIKKQMDLYENDFLNMTGIYLGEDPLDYKNNIEKVFDNNHMSLKLFLLNLSKTLIYDKNKDNEALKLSLNSLKKIFEKENDESIISKLMSFNTIKSSEESFLSIFQWSNDNSFIRKIIKSNAFDNFIKNNDFDFFNNFMKINNFFNDNHLSNIYLANRAISLNKIDSFTYLLTEQKTNDFIDSFKLSSTDKDIKLLDLDMIKDGYNVFLGLIAEIFIKKEKGNDADFNQYLFFKHIKNLPFKDFTFLKASDKSIYYHLNEIFPSRHFNVVEEENLTKAFFNDYLSSINSLIDINKLKKEFKHIEKENENDEVYIKLIFSFSQTTIEDFCDNFEKINGIRKMKLNKLKM